MYGLDFSPVDCRRCLSECLCEDLFDEIRFCFAIAHPVRVDTGKFPLEDCIGISITLMGAQPVPEEEISLNEGISFFKYMKVNRGLFF